MSEWKYQTDDILIAPYLPAKDYAPTEELLIASYMKAKADRTLELVMAGIGDVTLGKFLHMLRDKTIIAGIVKQPYNVAGIGWLWGVEGETGAKKAHLGFLFAREYWGKSEIRSISAVTLDWWFTESEIEVLFGSVLSHNRRALRFAREFSFIELADIPCMFTSKGKFSEGTLVMLRKEEFRQWAAVHPIAYSSNNSK